MVELLILVSDIIVISRLKMFKGISVEFMECFKTRMHRRKRKRTLLYISDKAVLIVARANLLVTKYEYYGFNDDLRDIIN